MPTVRPPAARARPALADRLFVYGCAAVYAGLLAAVLIVLKRYVG